MAVAVLAGGIQAGAHSVGSYYSSGGKDQRYPAGYQTALWIFEKDVPGDNNQKSSYKDAIRRAEGAWNGVAQPFTFEDSGYEEVSFKPKVAQIQSSNTTFQDYCALARNGRPLSVVFWETIKDNRPGVNNLAEADRCVYNDGSHKFYVNFDKTEGARWYRGSSSKVPRAPGSNFDNEDSKIDLQSVATHEFGHGLGQAKHWDPDKDLNNGRGGARCSTYESRRETMCALITAGTAWQRSLGPHDRETFKKAY
jgi:hypothetical protein